MARPWFEWASDRLNALSDAQKQNQSIRNWVDSNPWAVSAHMPDKIQWKPETNMNANDKIAAEQRDYLKSSWYNDRNPNGSDMSDYKVSQTYRWAVSWDNTF